MQSCLSLSCGSVVVSRCGLIDCIFIAAIKPEAVLWLYSDKKQKLVFTLMHT